MAKAISSTLPLLYLYRIGVLNWLPQIFEEVCLPLAVVDELKTGLQQGQDVPDPENYAWLTIVEPQRIPSEWEVLNLSEGELAVMALGLKYDTHLVLLDDLLARRMAQAAGLHVWGTLRILLEAKRQGLVPTVAQAVDNFAISGMWISESMRRRILRLANE